MQGNLLAQNIRRQSPAGKGRMESLNWGAIAAHWWEEFSHSSQQISGGNCELVQNKARTRSQRYSRIWTFSQAILLQTPPSGLKSQCAEWADFWSETMQARRHWSNPLKCWGELKFSQHEILYPAKLWFQKWSWKIDFLNETKIAVIPSRLTP